MSSAAALHTPPAWQAERHQDLNRLYIDHRGWLYGWLRRKLGDAHQAADLTHDTFLRLLARQEPLVIRDIREPRAFLTTIAQGMVSNFYRRQKLELAWLEAVAAMPEPLAPSAEARAIMLETLVEIDRLLDTLPVRIRQAFLLSQFDGLPQAEIAVQLGMSVPTVKRHIARALALCCFAQEMLA